MAAAEQYPSEADYTQEARLKDGTGLHLRAIRPSDAARLGDLMHRCSDESLVYRFLSSPTPAWIDRQLDYFSNVDHDRRMAIVAVTGDEADGNDAGSGDAEIVAVGSWDVLADDPTTAEVAFLVDDAWQGNGLGTILLSELAAKAQHHGIRSFDASVLADNRGMLDVFRKTGYRVTHEIDLGVYHLVFPIRPTAASRDADAGRESVIARASLAAILEPQQVVVVGPAGDDRSLGAQMLHNAARSRFTGTLFALDPGGRPPKSVVVPRSIDELPDGIDLVVVAGGVDDVIGDIESFATKGAKAVVVVSEEPAPGADRDRRDDALREACSAYGIRLVGPGSLGVVNTDPRVRLDLVAGETHSSAGVVGVAAHSGLLGIGVIEHLERLSVGVSQFVSLGDRADVNANDLLAFWEEDEATRVGLLYVESVREPMTFTRAARRTAMRKPVVALFSGVSRSEAGRSALARQCGVVEVETLEALADTASFLSTQPLPRGRRVAIVSNSTGAARIAAHACESVGLTVDEPPETTAGLLEGSGVTASNPVTLPLADDLAAAFAGALGAVAGNDEFDCILAICVPADAEEHEEVAAAIMKAARRNRDKAFAAAFMTRRGTAPFLRHRGVAVPAYAYPEAAAFALGRAAKYAAWRREPVGEYRVFEDVDVDALAGFIRGESTGLLDGNPADELIRRVGIGTSDSPKETFVIRLQDHPPFGPMIGLGSGADPSAIPADSFRFVPLTDRDADTLVQDVLAEVPESLDESLKIDTDALVDVILRLALLAEHDARIATGDLVVQVGGPGEGAGVSSISFRVD